LIFFTLSCNRTKEHEINSALEGNREESKTIRIESREGIIYYVRAVREDGAFNRERMT
jgi:hypothetical protein